MNKLWQALFYLVLVLQGCCLETGKQVAMELLCLSTMGSELWTPCTCLHLGPLNFLVQVFGLRSLCSIGM